MISIQRPCDQSTGAVSRPEPARQPAFPKNQLKPSTISAPSNSTSNYSANSKHNNKGPHKQGHQVST